MKQTAIEWFVEQLAAIRKQNSGYRNIEIELKELIDQAKAMEKKQIQDAFKSGNHTEMRGGKVIDTIAEQYYNETFKSERGENI